MRYATHAFTSMDCLGRKVLLFCLSLFLSFGFFDCFPPVSAPRAIDVWMPVMCSGEAAAVTVVAGFDYRKKKKEAGNPRSQL